jgi:AcrR family transcriptional regulator
MVEAAGELFAQHGYDGVTVRDICARAGASLSALNYHFRDKEGLFREALGSAVARDSLTAERLAALESLPPRQALLLLVREYAANLLSPGGPDWRTLLLEREYLDPSPAFRGMLAGRLQPEVVWLKGLVARAAGVPDGDAVALATMAMYGLVSSLFAYHEALELLAPGIRERCREGDAFPRLVVDLTIRTAKFPLDDRGGVGRNGGRKHGPAKPAGRKANSERPPN